MLDHMKKLSSLIMVIAFLAMNVASATAADCSDEALCGNFLNVVSVDDIGNQDESQGKAICDFCSCCHNHSNVSTLHGKAEYVAIASQALHNRAGDNYFSQLNYPPSKPPQS